MKDYNKIIAEILPDILKRAYTVYMYVSMDDTLIVHIHFYDSIDEYIELEIEDEKNIGAKLPNKVFKDFTLDTLKDFILNKKIDDRISIYNKVQ